MARLTVNNDALAEEFFDGTRLLGIVVPVKAFQLCWHLNHMMEMDFRINHDIEIMLTKKRRNYFFSIYEYQEPGGSLVHYLYNNQFDGEYLLPEFRNLDYLWLMKGDTVNDGLILDMVQSIKQIKSVQLVMELSTDMIKHKGHLIF
jgi:hypothetical protein